MPERPEAREIRGQFKRNRIRRSAAGDRNELTVPAAIARLIPADAEFHCELVDEGILFRKVKQPPIPTWIKRG